jgi:hypothetical protein
MQKALAGFAHPARFARARLPNKSALVALANGMDKGALRQTDVSSTIEKKVLFTVKAECQARKPNLLQARNPNLLSD